MLPVIIYTVHLNQFALSQSQNSILVTVTVTVRVAPEVYVTAVASIPLVSVETAYWNN